MLGFFADICLYTTATNGYIPETGYVARRTLSVLLQLMNEPFSCELFHRPFVSQPTALPPHLSYTLTVGRHMTPTSKKQAPAHITFQ
jgi:hypothetical protein